MNTPRPTPRTDALANTAWEGASDDYSAYAKMLHHAHTLETELADALEKIIRIKKSHEETERDEIESMREVIKEAYEALKTSRRQWAHYAECQEDEDLEAAKHHEGDLYRQGKAAKLEGFDFIGMEQDAGYFQIAQARCGIATK